MHYSIHSFSMSWAMSVISYSLTLLSIYAILYSVPFYAQQKLPSVWTKVRRLSHYVLVQHSITVGLGSDTKLARLFQTWVSELPCISWEIAICNLLSKIRYKWEIIVLISLADILSTFFLLLLPLFFRNLWAWGKSSDSDSMHYIYH